MATATASKNCCSFNHAYSLTTPPYKNGTIANPLPKTNAPALKKYQPICDNFSLVQVAAICKKKGNKRIELIDLFQVGGDLYNHTIIPAARISQRISFSVMNVTTASTPAMIHNNQLLPKLFFDSL